MKIIKECEMCQCEFRTWSYMIRNGNGRFCSSKCYGKHKDKGLTDFNIRIRRCMKYYRWRKAVFTRDNWTCQFCGKRGRKQTGGEIQADHIRPLAKILDDNGIKDMQSALNCKEIWDLSNGRTLCRTCHITTETFGKKHKNL